MSVKQFVTLFSALLLGCALLPFSSFAQLTFQPSQITSSQYVLVAHGDFNNDGREDLVAEDDTRFQRVDHLYLSNGDGTYRAPIKLPAVVQAIGDFNGDGKLDYATANVNSTDNSTTVTVFLGNGDGTFQAPKNTTGIDELPFSLVPADLNHDGKTDLVEFIFRNSSNTFTIPARLQLLISKGDGTFSKGQTIVAATGSLANESLGTVLTGDFDGDSKPDVAVTYNDTANLGTTVQVFYGDGAGHLGSPSLTVDPKHFTESGPMVADVNNDGRSDIVSDGDDSAGLLQLLTIFTGNANRTFGYSTIPTNQCPQGLAVADFNGDGLNDIAYADAPCDEGNPPTDIAIRLGEGAGKFGAEEAVYQNLEQIQVPFAIKSTLGTKPDIVFSETENNGGNLVFELLTNTSDGAFPGCGASGFAVGVKVCAPAATSTSPVKFSVGTAGPTPMRTAQVWVDGKKAAEQLTHAFSNYSFLDASVPLAAGSHRIAVLGTGWDGAMQEKAFTLTVSGTSCSAPTAAGVHICAPASGASVSSPVTIQAASTIDWHARQRAGLDRRGEKIRRNQQHHAENDPQRGSRHPPLRGSRHQHRGNQVGTGRQRNR